MGRTRFMVERRRKSNQTAVFAVLGVIILVGLIAFFLNMGEALRRISGRYLLRGNAAWRETAEVAVTIAEGRIAEVSMEEATEAVAVFYPLLAEVTETVGQAVIENQSAEIAVESENPTFCTGDSGCGGGVSGAGGEISAGRNPDLDQKKVGGMRPTEQEKRRTQERDGAADARKAEFSGERRTGAKRHARVSDVCDGGFGGRLSADFLYLRAKPRIWSAIS
ncbi:MAG: hypothetical protein V8Q32_06425 [Anaerotignum faecicola]